MLVTNGMSEYKRDRENANSALVVSVGTEDFPVITLSGMEFQRIWSKAFEMLVEIIMLLCSLLEIFSLQ